MVLSRNFFVRSLRTRARVSTAPSYTPETAPSSWPPLPLPQPITPNYCNRLLKDLETEEIQRIRKSRNFQVPRITEGDLVEVKYEISRSKGSFAIFSGYCIEVRRKGLSGGFVLKNVFDGVGVEQFFPWWSGRLLDVRMVKKLESRPVSSSSPRLSAPRSRHYRYQWHTFIRQRHSEGKRVHWRMIRQNPGIMSLEPKLKTELALLRRRYHNLRVEAGLPPYLWPGPYHVHNRQARELRAEQARRMLVYAMDERREQAGKKMKAAGERKWWKFTQKANLRRSQVTDKGTETRQNRLDENVPEKVSQHEPGKPESFKTKNPQNLSERFNDEPVKMKYRGKPVNLKTKDAPKSSGNSKSEKSPKPRIPEKNKKRHPYDAIDRLSPFHPLSPGNLPK